MTKTKQTACGGSSSRPAAMATARFGDEAEDSQFKDIPEEEWPDMDKPPQAAEVGQASKSAGKEGDQPPTQKTEGGATAPPTDNPQDPQASTSATAPPQAPTDKPQDPQTSTSTDDPGLKEYVDSYMQAAQDWFDNVQEAKINAYMEFYDTLLELGKPHIKV